MAESESLPSHARQPSARPSWSSVPLATIWSSVTSDFQGIFFFSLTVRRSGRY
jgi:hypothetical protein